MAYTDVNTVRLLTNLTSNDISDEDITNIIAEATKELNAMINVHVDRERVFYIDTTRENKIDGSNTTYYVQNWHGRFLADMNDDGTVDTNDVIVYQVDTDGTETKPTVSSIDVDSCNITLSSAPASGVRLYITYEWCYRNPSTPDPVIKLACTLLVAAYCYAKINVGRAPQVAFGNTRLYRHMDSFDDYYRRFLKVVSQINQRMGGYKESTETV